MKIKKGKHVKFDYETKVDGVEIDNSRYKTPMQYVHGKGGILKGLAEQLEGMEVGEEKTVYLSSKKIYGESDPNKIVEVNKSTLPISVAPEKGVTFKINKPTGNSYQAKIVKVKKDTVVVDANHPLAGKTLEFNIKIIEVV